MVRNMDSVPDDDIMVRNGEDGGSMRLWFGMGAAAGLYDQGADWKMVLGLVRLRCGL